VSRERFRRALDRVAESIPNKLNDFRFVRCCGSSAVPRSGRTCSGPWMEP